MDKAEHGSLLKTAIQLAGMDRQVIADAAGVNVRTVTNWTTGQTMPSARERDVLRRLLGEYDRAGDPVELAVRRSSLTEWRKDAVLSFYKRNLYEQEAEAG